MVHRRFLVIALLALAAAAPAGTQPNVVLVVTDDQRVDTIGPRKTPAIWNLLLKRGARYANAHVPTSVCCPSRASILTGLFAHSTGVYGNAPPDGGWPTFHERGMELRTVAAALQAVGYRTGLVGKYLNSWAPDHVPPGWDTFEAFNGGYYGYWFMGTQFGGEPGDYSTDVLRERAVEFVRSTATEQPLFLYFAPYAPHAGSIPAPRHAGSWLGRLPRYLPPSLTENVRDKPPWIRGLRRTRQAKIDAVLQRRAESMLAVDEAVRAIHDALVETGRMNDTLFIYLSDNGILLGEHRVYGHKNLPYRLATQVPLLARWDGRIQPGTTYWKLVLNVDLAPTIAGAAGAGMQTEGLDLLGPVRREGFPLEGRDWQHRPNLYVPAFCGYRTSRFTYARYASGHEELYDYYLDPHELANKARKPQYAGTLASLRARAMEECAPVPPGFAWPDPG